MFITSGPALLKDNKVQFSSLIRVIVIYCLLETFVVYYRPLLKSAYQKIIFLISQSKHMLWVFKRTLSMRRFF